MWNLKYHSPSSLNLYRANPGAWLMRYGFGVKQEDKAWPTLGNAMEFALAIHAGLAPKPADIINTNIADLGLVYFENVAAGQIDENWDTCRKAIPIIAPRLEEAHKDCFDGITDYQVNAEASIDGAVLPLYGKIDFYGDCDDKIVLDLKIKKTMPSTPQQEHVRQVGAYAKARGAKRAGLIYVSAAAKPKVETMVYWLTEPQITYAWLEMCQAARAIEAITKIAPTPQEMAKLIAPNWDDYRFGDDLREKAMEIWA